LTDLEDLSKTPETVVTEELQRWPRNEEEEKLAQTLNERRITACIPLKAGDKLLGYFLLGEKIGKHVITSTDIACLEDIGTSLALYIDNYRLSNQLKGRLEELETVYEQLQKADEFKTEIINVTSHELRTPLTILSAFTQLLLEKYSRLDEGERNEYLLHIKEACERLESVVRQFLNVSSLQQGAVVSDIQSLSLVELLNRVKAHYGVEEQNRIKIECPDDRMTVLSDDFYLSEMLKNLTENALRFGPQDESVLIRAEPKGEMVKISIEDSGDGIHIDEAEEIFNAFTRLEDLDKHHSGIGLGLYTVRLIADLLETQVKVSSAAKGGASFSFDVPAGSRD
jgi:K+-sensing histidine kinase KdpD